MKILLDMNLSPVWVEALREAGIEAQHWSAVGDGHAVDKEIFEWASRNGFVYTGPSVVQFRTHRILSAETAATIVRVLRQHEADLDRGAVLVVDSEGSRVIPAPLEGCRGAL